ncbi:MAG: TIGR00282 family metallophosphoesterase [Phycisphaeraceae bacterium]|nr:TIGR00282 family metallophosphoesterase [Phycisphaeraceae bacterium]
MTIRLAMLGDIVGAPGRQAVVQQIPVIQSRWQTNLIIANAENAANGSGLTPEQYAKLRQSGIDGITLGDHAFRRAQITHTLETESDIIRPANLPAKAVGKSWMRLQPHTPGLPCVFVVTLLGRIFSNFPANDPFSTIDQILAQLPETNPIVLVEIHAEATSEKQAMGWYLDGRVSAVVGTHTHVPTADARILPKGTAYITDIGMCGPQVSVLGRRVDRILAHMTTGAQVPFDVAEDDPRVCGVVIDIDPRTRKATAIERLELAANPNAPPFVA